MLKFLVISQFALIDHLEIEFDKGLNLLTGETGSGKSIIVDALGLLLGEKGFAELIRTGADKATVSGFFELQEEERVRKRFEGSGLEFNPGELIVKRELAQGGKSRALVNGQMVPVGFLKEIARFLVDIHGQNDEQALLNNESQLQFLDAYANMEGLQSRVGDLYGQFQQISQQLRSLKTNDQQRLRSIDLLTFQISEIEKARLKSEDEDEALVLEHKLLANADKLHQLSTQAYLELYEAEASAISAVKHASRVVEELKRVDPRCEGLLEQLQTARITIEDVALSLREYSSSIEINPSRLEWVENRMAEIERLKRKYGGSVKEIFSFYRDKKRELESLQQADESTAALEKGRVEIKQTYRKHALDLSEGRKAAAKLLEKSVEKELSQLAMERTRFRVSFIERDTSDKGEGGEENIIGTGKGIDEIEFLISPNPGEDLKPLVKIASGGEISRIMLALKTVKAIDSRSKTLVFDEVDAGIGGQTADVVAQKLKRLSKRNQIICVTHLPQIASYADNHYSIQKRVEKGRTVTQVARLDKQDRVQEIARMMSGERITESVLRHAAELLRAGSK
jgi:DNA repair protein RecN (Recombination protein N)